MKQSFFKNKNCLIVGATGGIGAEIAKQLANKNCNLFLLGKNKNKLFKLKKLLQKKNQTFKIEFKTIDLTKADKIKNTIKIIRKKFKNIDILINCAGIFDIKSLEKSSLKDFDDAFHVNVRSTFIFCKEFSREMVKKKWGRIVNIGSSSSYNGFKNSSIYCSSKHAILGLSRALNEELKVKNVRVFCFSPGSTQTKMGKISKDQDFSTFLDPEEVAETIIYLISFDKEMIMDEIKMNRIKIS